MATGALLLLVLVLYGAPVPRLSEELYLPLVRHVGDHSFLAGDWTLRGPFGEHWVFDHVFGPLAAAMPLTWFGWLGRLVSWSALAYLLVRLGRRYELGPIAAACGVGLWLVMNQSLIGSDWMFGTFEAKTVADILVVGAILAATNDRVPLTLALFGAAISVHPGLGGWAAFAGVAALLANPRTRTRTLRWSLLGAAFAAPGVIAVWSSLGAANTRMQEFLVISAIPYHADPFFGGARLPGVQVVVRAGALALMLAANVAWFRRSDRGPARQFLVTIQIMAFIPVVVAFVGRALDAWQFLVLQPLRFGPLLIPLLFFFQLVERVLDLRAHEGVKPWWRRRSAVLATGGLMMAVVVTAPLLAAPRMVRRTVHAWIEDDPQADAFNWLSDHTPPSLRCVVPVDHQDEFFRGERPMVANWQAIRYDRLGEWKRRIDALVGGPAFFTGGFVDLAQLRAAYDHLTREQITAVANRYHAGCIVATTRYDLPLLHEVGGVRIYRNPGTAAP
ncbi:MAG: hypothetical protein ACXV8Y_10645 [Acidimicrobiia bacterium]